MCTMCTTSASGAQGAQHTALDSPKMELQMVVSYHVGAGIRSGPSSRAINALDH